MPTIELTDEEQALARRLLERTLAQILHEIHHTTYDRTLKEELRREATAVEGILKKLGAGAG